MKVHRSKSVAAATCLGVLMSSSAVAVESANVPPRAMIAPTQASPAPTEVTDVALTSEGVFCGQVVDASGRPAAGTMVTVQQNGHDVALTSTDGQGCFRLSGLRGGVYQLSTGSSRRNIRLWAAGSEPPTARPSVLLTTSDDVVRGQMKGSHGIVWWLTNPWILATGVAAAIAVPIALDNNDPSSS